MLRILRNDRMTQRKTSSRLHGLRYDRRTRLRPIIGIVMKERTASSQFICKRLDTYSLSRVLVILSSTVRAIGTRRQTIQVGHISISAHTRFGQQRLFHIVRVIGTVFVLMRVEFYDGMPGATPVRWGVWGREALENDLFEVRSKTPENKKEVGVRCRRRRRTF